MVGRFIRNGEVSSGELSIYVSSNTRHEMHKFPKNGIYDAPTTNSLWL